MANADIEVSINIVFQEAALRAEQYAQSITSLNPAVLERSQSGSTLPSPFLPTTSPEQLTIDKPVEQVEDSESELALLPTTIPDVDQSATGHKLVPPRRARSPPSSSVSTRRAKRVK